MVYRKGIRLFRSTMDWSENISTIKHRSLFIVKHSMTRWEVGAKGDGIPQIIAEFAYLRHARQFSELIKRGEFKI